MSNQTPAKKPKFSNTDLANVIAEEFGLNKKVAARIIKKLHDTISEKVRDDAYDGVQITDFGIYRVRSIEARKGRNPQTGETVDIPARNRLVFKPSSVLKALL